jgi:tetratricopeptide (TPR) repeat protein
MILMAAHGGMSPPDIGACLGQAQVASRQPMRSLLAAWAGAVDLPWETAASQLAPDKLLVLVNAAFARRHVMSESEWNDFRNSADIVIERVAEDARAEIWAELGEDWYWDQDLAKAGNCLEKAKEYFVRNDRAERSVVAAQQIARLCEQLKDPATEVEVLEDALALHPDHDRAAVTLNMLVNTYVELGDTTSVHALRGKLLNEFPRCRLREEQLLGLRLEAGLPLAVCSRTPVAGQSGKGGVQ